MDEKESLTGEGMLEQSVPIKLLRDNKGSFVPVTTPDAVIYGVVENSGDAITLTDKLKELFGEDTSIGSRLNRIDEDLDSIHNQIDGENNKDSIQQQIDNNDEDIAIINTRINGHDTDISEIKTDIGTTNERIDELNTRKADKSYVDAEFERVDNELDLKATVTIIDGQYPNGSPKPGTSDYCNTYNAHYIDNYMISKKQAEEYISQTVDSQTYSKSELDKMLGQALHVLTYEQGVSDITLVPDYKCQYLDLTSVEQDVTITFPNMSENSSNNNNIDYRYAKFHLYINTGRERSIVINSKNVILNPGFNEIEITYILGNWLLSKKEFLG